MGNPEGDAISTWWRLLVRPMKIQVGRPIWNVWPDAEFGVLFGFHLLSNVVRIKAQSLALAHWNRTPTTSHTAQLFNRTAWHTIC